MKVKFNWDKMNQDRGDLKRLRGWYEDAGEEKEVIKVIRAHSGELFYILKGFTDIGFSSKELIFIPTNDEICAVNEIMMLQEGETQP